MNNSTVVLLTFAGTSMGVLGLSLLVYETFFRRRVRIDERLKSQLRDDLRGLVQHSPLFKDLQQLAADSALPTPTLLRRLQVMLEQSGTRLSLQSVVALSCFGAMVGMTAGGLLSNWLAALILTLALGAAPFFYIQIQRRRRVWLLTLQLPDAFEVMSRALRVGQTMSSAFQRVADDFQSPIREEFSYCWEQQHLGIATDVALRDLARRSGILEMQIFAVTVIVASKTGSNMADMFTKLAGLVRMRIRLKAKVRALTGESRMQAVVLTVLPGIVFVALWFMNREYAQKLLDHRAMLFGTMASVTIGSLWINRIVTRAAAY
jgi:tight adherence protein B